MRYNSGHIRSSNRRTNRVLTPAVYRLAADRSYREIPALVKERPSDLEWTDSYGSTTLHLLCQVKQVTPELLSAVKACVEALPCSVQWANASTWTPLHFAVQYAGESKFSSSSRFSPLDNIRSRRSGSNGNSSDDSEDSASLRIKLILLLLVACPAAVHARVTTGYKTKTAFHMACETNAPYYILKAMLQIDPSLATATYISPKQPRTTYMSNPISNYSSTSETPIHILWNSSKSIRKTALVLEAAYKGKIEPRRRIVWKQFQILHAACCIECPRDFFQRVLEDNPLQSFQCDERGFLPLHTLLMKRPSSYFEFCLERLLEQAPRAATIPDPDGILPLHHALRNGWTVGINELCFCYPNSLRVADPTTKLVPFLAAASSSEEFHRYGSLSTIFDLLLAAPEMLETVKKT